jgi:hypothetical protein
MMDKDKCGEYLGFGGFWKVNLSKFSIMKKVLNVQQNIILQPLYLILLINNNGPRASNHKSNRI